MRRVLLLALAAPVLLSASDPLAEAEREARRAVAEQARLEAAAAGARDAAEKARLETEAAAQALLGANADIAASEARLIALERRKRAVEERLGEARAPSSALLAGLAQLGRRPAWMTLASSGGAEEQVRLLALVRAVRPEVERRAATLRGEYDALRILRARQANEVAALRRKQEGLKEAQLRFADRERAATALFQERGSAAVVAGDAVLQAGERVQQQQRLGEQRRQASALAAALAALPAAEPRPAAPEGTRPSAPLAWLPPASGRVTAGMGELGPNGVRSRGISIAAAIGTEVVAPAPGRVAFAGPFRRRVGVVIIDHGGGWSTLLTEVRPTVRQGDRVNRGDAIGRAAGPLTAELFRDGTAEPAALIARSSSPLL